MLRTSDRLAAATRRPIAWRVFVIVIVAFAALIAVALFAPQSALAATSTASTSSATDAQKTQRVFTDTNEVRAEAGTTPLVRNAALDKVAADWALQQWKNGAMSHNPNYSTQIPKGWSHAGENVAAGYTYDTVVPAWVKSAEHYKNLVGDYTDVGIGYYEGPDGDRYWSQVFGKYASTQVPPKQTPTASATPTASPSATTAPSATPSATATPAPAATSGSYSAEPAAPAGTAIALSSPSFEGSLAGWTASGGSLEGPTTAARGGRYDLAISGGTTVSQSVTTTVTAGETDTVSIWVKPGTSTKVAGSLKLSAVGGSAETATVSFSVSSGWMKVSVALPVTKAGHTGFTIQLALSTSGAAYRVDSASLVRTTAAPAAPPTAAAPAASAPATTPAKPATSTPTSPTAPAASAPAPAPSSSASPAPAPASGGIDLGVIKLGLGG